MLLDWVDGQIHKAVGQVVPCHYRNASMQLRKDSLVIGKVKHQSQKSILRSIVAIIPTWASSDL